MGSLEYGDLGLDDKCGTQNLRGNCMRIAFLSVTIVLKHSYTFEFGDKLP